MKENNLLSCVKHFPGYGNNTNTHTGMSVDKRSWESFEERDLKPFKAGVDAGVPFLMVSHNVIDDLIRAFRHHFQKSFIIILEMI